MNKWVIHSEEDIKRMTEAATEIMIGIAGTSMTLLNYAEQLWTGGSKWGTGLANKAFYFKMQKL